MAVTERGIDLAVREQPNFAGVPLDREAVSQAMLNIDNKRRSNLFPWNGQFSPQLIEVLLLAFAPKKCLFLDPFAGSGTVMYEAGRLEMPVVGSEINPTAFKMAQVYCLMNLPVAQRKTAANQVDKVLEERLPDQEPSLFSAKGRETIKGVKETLVETLIR